MEMITGLQITGFLWSLLIADWAISVRDGDSSALDGPPVVKWLQKHQQNGGKRVSCPPGKVEPGNAAV